MADVKFDLEVTGVPELRKASREIVKSGRAAAKLAAQFKPLGAQTMRLVKEQERLAGVQRSLKKAVKEERIEAAEATRAMQEEIRVSKERVLTDKTLIAQAKKAAKAEEDRKKKITQLTRAYAPARVAAAEYRETVKEIKRAHKEGIITDQERAESLSRVAFEYNQFTQGLATGGNQFAKFNVESYRANQRMKRFASVGMQQAGYQVGDFIVQVQGGTDMLVALGQQGSQLAGIFGAKGAIIGAVLAAATSIGMIFKQTKEAAEGSAEDIKNAFSTLPDYFDGLGVSIYDSFEDSFDRIEERYGKLIADIARKELELLKTSAKSVEGPVAKGAAPSFAEQLGAALAPGVVGYDTALQRQAQANIQAETEELFKSVKPVNDILDAYKEQVDAVQTQAELLELVNNTYQELLTTSEDAADAFRQQAKDLGIAGEIAKAEKAAREQEAETLKERKENMLEMIQLFRDFQKSARDEEEETRREREENQLEMIELFRDAQKSMREEEAKTAENAQKAFDSKTESLREEIALNRTKINFHQTEETLAAGMAQLRRHELELEMAKLGLTKTQKEELRAQLTTLLDQEAKLREIEQQEKDRVENAKRLAEALKESARAMQSLSGFGNSLDKAIAVAEARVEALKTGADAAVAGRIAGLRTDLEVRLAADGLRPEAAADLRAEFESKINTLAGLLGQEAGLKTKPKSSSKKTPAEQIEEFMAKQEQANKVQRKRILLGEEEARVTELINKYKEAGVPLDLERIRTLVEEEQQLQKLESAHASLTDALMSVVDGTQSVGDAFKSLLREMLLDIYREQIAKQYATSFLGLFGFAKGGVFSGGSQVKAFANGGVVGGPTYFPMSGGQTGLMGEAGPEAIMPLKRGADGKLGVQVEGSSGAVNIVQNFSFSANGDESVKKLIAQAAPQIANLTQKQIVDSRRRGGSLKSTFG